MLATRLQKSKLHWNDMGRMDPCWAILSAPEKKFGHWDLDEFLASGEVEIANLISDCDRLALPRTRRRALDFGCGLGRLTQALGKHFEEAVGLDISESMISRAREICNLRNCRFVVSDQPLLPFSNGEFDLIYCTIVLQHIPDRRLIKHYIREFIRTLGPGGLLVMQLPSHIPFRNRLQLRRRLYSMLRSFGISVDTLYQSLGLNPIIMNFIPEKEVSGLIDNQCARLISCVPDKKAGAGIESRTYSVTK